MATTHAFLDDLISAKEGYLVNIASASAFVGCLWQHLRGKQMAVVGFESIRLELDVRKINTSCDPCAHYISTGMFDSDAHVPPMLTPESAVALFAACRRKTALCRAGHPKSTELLKALPRKAWMKWRTASVSTSMWLEGKK